MKIYRCRACGCEYEVDPDTVSGTLPCPECDSRDILPLKTNSGMIEHDADGDYETGEGDTDDLDDLEEDEEPGSLFDKREFDEED